ncbi:ABC transporter ATP-binding protein [Alsobacter sp. R-9]
MSDVVIRAEGLGKKYLIGHEERKERYTALRDVIARQARGLARSARDLLAGRPSIAGDEIEEFWALRDVDFEIRCGDVVGIIGRNGAGKSTLLKILSRITEPTAGRVTIRGRVASLLEVGTGFHPELTGRENIYLNGAILGMTRAEIRRKFDEIVDFAGVERFLDTPVKRYSSGMYVRLAFAVAAHLEPEILVVDEVLAVGDADFQKKCLSKMRDVGGSGRTVLFVSHNLAAVQALCDRGLLLQQGAKLADGAVNETLLRYASSAGGAAFRRGVRAGTGPSLIEASVEVVVQTPPGSSPRRVVSAMLAFATGQSVDVNIDLRVRDQFGAPVAYGTLGGMSVETPVRLEPGTTVVNLELDVSTLVVGRYTLGVDLTKPFSHKMEQADDVVEFDIDMHHWPDVVQPARQSFGLGNVILPLRRLG